MSTEAVQVMYGACMEQVWSRYGAGMEQVRTCTCKINEEN